MRLETSRIILRPWEHDDLVPFRALNADRDVMRFFPAPLSSQESDALAASLQERMHRQGFGAWALEIPGVTRFAGFLGLNIPGFDSSMVEAAWRLHKNFWGQGYATEGAAMALEAGFSFYGLKEIVSFTATLNLPSERVMQRLGMEHRPQDDFNHPALPPEHPLSRHVLYRMSRERWNNRKKHFPVLDHMHMIEA